MQALELGPITLVGSVLDVCRHPRGAADLEEKLVVEQYKQSNNIKMLEATGGKFRKQY